MSKPALAIGVGNLLWADEGFGVRCVEAFAERFQPHEQLTVADGGTQGLYLVDFFRTHDPIVIFDAVDFGDEPGSMRVVYDEEIPAFVAAHKLSLHQAGLQDVIACARLLGGCASQMILIGVQPLELEDYGGSLRPPVKACIPSALDIAADYLANHGISLDPRTDQAAPTVITPGLDILSYEEGRPNDQAAYRHGDERVLRRAGDA